MAVPLMRGWYVWSMGCVGGSQEAKAEIMEFVEFLRNPGKFQRLGAKIPRVRTVVR